METSDRFSTAKIREEDRRDVSSLREYRPRRWGVGNASFELTTADLEFWTADEGYAAEPGKFEVQVGHAADDITTVETFKPVE